MYYYGKGYIKSVKSDLDKEAIGEEWDKIWDQRIMKNMSVRIKENCYKVIWRWYLMLVKPNIINKNVLSLCWRCKKEKGTYIHMWWSCELRKQEWKQIFKEIREITGLNIQMSPSMALLNLVKKDQLLKENKDLIVIMITAARLIFARNWKNDNQLNLEEWYRELWDMAINDKLTCDMKIRRGLSK